METRSPGSPPASQSGPFNGATALRRWKPTSGTRGLASMRNLQWSHRPSAMETLCIFPAPRSSLPPSMEPPPFGDGNWASSLLIPISWRTFNGATALRRWKRLAYGILSVSQLSFNGATALRRWKRAPILHDRSGHRAFNGATALRRWKRAASRLLMVPNWFLQWSHRPSAMETAICV